MPLDTDEKLDALFLSNLGQIFQSRLADQASDFEAVIAAYKSKLEQLEQEFAELEERASCRSELDDVRKTLTDVEAQAECLRSEQGQLLLRLANAEQLASSGTVAKAETAAEMRQIRQVILEARVEAGIIRSGHDHLVARLANVEQQVASGTIAKAETAVELRHVRDAIVDARVEARVVREGQSDLTARLTILADQASRAISTNERISGEVAKLRSEMAKEVAALTAEEAEALEASLQVAVAKSVQFEAARIEADVTAGLALQDKTIGHIDERLSNVQHVAGETAGAVSELREYLVGERGRLENVTDAFKEQLLVELSQARSASEQRFITALQEAHTQAVTLARDFVEEHDALAYTSSESGVRAERSNCIDWLVRQGESALRPASTSVDLDSAQLWTDDIFVDAAFRWLLGRPVDPSGLDHYVEQLRRTTCRRNLLLDIARSKESVNRIRHSLSLERDDQDFLSHAYSLLLGRKIDSDGQNHYLTVLRGTSERGRYKVMRDLAFSQEAIRSQTIQASSWRFVTQASSPSIRWQEFWRRLRPGSRAAQRHTWQSARIMMIEAEMRRTAQRSHTRIDEIREKLIELVCAIHAAENAHIANALSLSFSPLSPVHETVAPQAYAPVDACPQKSKPTLQKLLGDTSLLRQVAGIAQAIRAELQELGIN
ncbi:DUF4214 domain-containing protein [Novosphingobium sp. PY1]|uniref:DUF4214 domain-containing protein n=1 Tax=Novosphingobium sp. PY1 TaxID=1882221 RepID=UPI001A902AEF|nr:DUF4214 domain-containing protein [Novosphingobium sp. PY1]GFM31472.1 uncharacterized protein PY1_contig-18-10 [Novosphingobium sp. PY1]